MSVTEMVPGSGVVAARGPGWLPAVVLTFLDAVLTYVWLQTGLATEGNPWLAGLVESAGAGTAMGVRAVVGIALVAALSLLARRYAAAGRGLLLVTGVLGLVLGWHIGGSVTTAFLVL